MAIIIPESKEALLAIGDLHLKIPSMEEVKLVCKKCIGIVKEKNVTRVCFVGDLHDSFAKMFLLCWNVIVDIFEEFSDIVPTYYIIGNHDALNNQIFLDNNHFFNAFKKWKNVYIIDKPTFVRSDDGLNLLFCPYVPPGRLVESLETVPNWKDAHIIFCHQEFRNAQMGSIISINGDVWDESWPFVVNGHIHEASQLQSNIRNIGSPYHTNFGEVADKTVSIFRAYGGKIQEERIDLGIPKKVTVTITAEEFPLYGPDKEDQVRLIVTGTSVTLSKLKNTNKYIELSKTIKIICKPTDKPMVVNSRNNKNYLDFLKEFAAHESENEGVRSILEEVLYASETN